MPLIVGIGASAGGLDAFKSFFGAMPADTGMAFVLVQHLSPDHKSMLAELVGKATDMSVVEADDGAPVEANTVFVIRPDSTLTIVGGRLQVVQPAPPRELRRPIDTFFRSLAEDQGENAIGLVLAGTGSDGSLGLAAIKEHGGLTLAQAEADHRAMPGMPLSATETGQVDDVLPVEAMPPRLIEHGAHLASVAARKDADGARTDAGTHLSSIMAALRARSGHDFSQYKQKTLVRRLQRRMQVLRVDTPAAYIDHYRQHPEELDLLLRELLIGVTEFFRDPTAFEALAQAVLKPLITGKGADDEIRVWVPGCATGQEAYSIAILLREAMGGRRGRPKVQIFATDIDERAIAVARLGRYPRPVAGLSPERIERWFADEGENCCVVPEIREMCVFSTHSVIKHPPFSKLDLISCRNLLIYLDAAMQDRVMRTFHYALKSGGWLFLGSSESASRATRLFAAKDKKHRIFERQEIDRPTLPDLPISGRGSDPVTSAKRASRQPPDGIEAHTRQVTEKYNPPHVVVDAKDQIVRFSGPAMGDYLELSAGAPSFALFSILRRTMRPAVRAALMEARASHRVVRHERIPVRIGGRSRSVTLIAEPLASQGAEAGFTALIFRETGDGAAGGPASAGEDTTDAIKALEEELRTTRTQLQSTIDELETANEELKSANEEHQSVNEELQSSNEELETAKEEMQSVNEEVQTINAELASKNEQLTLLNSDLRNLFDSTEIATLFLDVDMRVKRFTPGLRDLFHVREADIGRPIAEIVSLLDYRDLQRDAQAVLRNLTTLERQVRLEGGGMTFILRLRPYRTIDNLIDGVVLTFIDITARQAADEAVRASEAKFRMLFDYIDEGFCILQKVETGPGQPSDFRFISANPGFEVQSGVSDAVGKTIREVAPGETEEWFDIYDGVLANGKSVRFERDLVSRARVLDMFAFRFDDGTGPKLGVIFLDISQRRHHEEQQELLLKEMDHRVKNLFAVVGGMVSLSARSAQTPADMAETVRGRLGALASAHVLVLPQWGTKASPTHATLRDLIGAVLSPYADPAAEDDPRIVIDGPEVLVSGEAATSMALVIHELATNAAKYGALSVPGGQVRIGWSTARGRLSLSWTEAGGPPLKGPPSREGFGSMLARRSVTGQLGGDMLFHWNAEGLSVDLAVLMERLRA